VQVEWYGQSAFRLTDGATTVFIDPFDDLGPLAERGLRWDYPAIEGVQADLLLVTHEHLDHNGVAAIAGLQAAHRSGASHGAGHERGLGRDQPLRCRAPGRQA
jgi:L-ascorbate metabolism protein UlaG (beta-lactamase superfamily)